MSAPYISPFVVDQTRLGGMGSQQRHGFNILPGPRWKKDPSREAPPALPAAPSRAAVPPPPSRLGELGYGLMQAPELNESQIRAIQASAMPVIEAMRTDLEGLKLQASALTPENLRQNADSYKTLNELGPYFTPQEMRSQVVLDTRALQAEASRVLSGALSPYLTDAQVKALENVVGDAQNLIAYVQQYDLAPIEGAKSKLSDDHLRDQITGVRLAVADAERQVVSQEAPSVPVIEPGERTLGTIIAVGALAAVTWALIELL